MVDNARPVQTSTQQRNDVQAKGSGPVSRKRKTRSDNVDDRAGRMTRSKKTGDAAPKANTTAKKTAKTTAKTNGKKAANTAIR